LCLPVLTWNTIWIYGVDHNFMVKLIVHWQDLQKKKFRNGFASSHIEWDLVEGSISTPRHNSTMFIWAICDFSDLTIGSPNVSRTLLAFLFFSFKWQWKDVITHGGGIFIDRGPWKLIKPTLEVVGGRLFWANLLVLPPYQIIGQLCILRQTLTINFSQENMRYIT
jgi:hypothetical protein